MRSGPMRASAHGMSSTACDGCIDAITPSSWKRGTSAGLTTCACSMRGRVSRVDGAARITSSKNVERFAIRAIADRVNRHLEAGAHHRRHAVAIEAVLGAADAAMARAIAVRIEEERAARSHRAVVERLHAADGDAPRRIGWRRRPRPLARR